MSRFSERTARIAGRVRPRRTRRRLVVVGAVALLAPFLTTSVSTAVPNNANDSTPSAPEQATTFRIATFNLLGAGHTDGNPPKRKNFAKSTVRMGHAVKAIRNSDLGLLGFQEMQAPQYAEFLRLTGDTYGLYPGNQLSAAAMHNSIAWRKSEWNLVTAQTLAIPYGFKKQNGKQVVSRIQMPVLLLERIATGQQVWVSNFHNAAKVVGPQAHRNEARQLQMAMVKNLRAQNPAIPVFVMGDLNEQKKVFCQFQRKAPLQAAGPGGVTSANKCVTPSPMGVDWIFGTTDVTFSNHQRLRTAAVKKASDHPLVYADVYVAPAREQASPVKRVIAISVDGLRAGYVRKNAAKLPALNKMMREGVTTTNAHTVADSTLGLPNQVSIVTGRPAKKAGGGHGIKKEKVKKTVHQKAGGYVPSIFDVAHDNGRSTSAFTMDAQFNKTLNSWNAGNGARDTQGLDNGRQKFSVRKAKAKPAKVVTAARKRLKSSPDSLTFVHLTAPDQAGHSSGFASKKWRKSVAAADKQVGRLLKLVANQSHLRGSTLVVLTSANGGHKKAHSNGSDRQNHTVPFFLWGPGLGMPAGSDLFALNPHLKKSADQVPNGVATVRNASLANVVLTALRLPSVTGSAFGWAQHVSWRGAPAASNNGT
ncbi:alkaline phosphatase family protein [Nocardioides alcanivorans]|uniref:alkaline phosphatase family protein n=1 Tax=Nocardioides alcanivorans TaxID=2897352 RepID=UPI001F33B3E4|nr:alkaline phosphatase family protein [Nocardioides alcanivorans]